MTPTPSLTQENRHQRRTPPAARGEAATWITGGALLICLALIVTIVAVIVYRGGRTFWPGPIDLITLESGERVLGVPLNTQPVDPSTPDALRQRFRVGNRDLGQESFRWIDRSQIKSSDSPRDAWYVERGDWGVFLGLPESILLIPEQADAEPVVVAQGPDAVRETFARLHAEAVARRKEITHLNDVDAPRLQGQINNLEWSRRRVLKRNNPEVVSVGGLPTGRWLGVLGAAAVLALLTIWLIRLTSRTSSANPKRKALTVASIAGLGLTVSLGLASTLENPWASSRLSESQVQTRLDALDGQRTKIEAKLRGTLDELAALRAEDSRTRIVIRDPKTDRFAPESRSEAGVPMRLSQIVRVVPSNELGTAGRIGVYLSRWWEFLSDEPRMDGTEGGVFPVIVGTVTLTVLLTICVVPLGVIAAFYLREYARQGAFTSAIRIAINNLAGVPSIVYGMFGLGFFCYFLGGFIDEGPAVPTPRPAWWVGVAGVVLLIVLGTGSTLLATRRPGSPPSRIVRLATLMSWVLWTGAIVGAGWLVFTTPYFSGFFGHKLPESPTFGGRGILWASLTLSLLTLPVVIVATEEAIAAVPNSMREGSLACGASKWQTIRRVVLPSSLPGVMTGAILAMARGAGEVAPLMLVGAVNFAPSLPVSAEAPFLHGDRTFMHLGFHIYSLGFQSTDSEAAEPLVWTTTLLLISIVLILNLVAVIARAKLRSQMSSASI